MSMQFTDRGSCRENVRAQLLPPPPESSPRNLPGSRRGGHERLNHGAHLPREWIALSRCLRVCSGHDGANSIPVSSHSSAIGRTSDSDDSAERPAGASALDKLRPFLISGRNLDSYFVSFAFSLTGARRRFIPSSAHIDMICRNGSDQSSAPPR